MSSGMTIIMRRRRRRRTKGISAIPFTHSFIHSISLSLVAPSMQNDSRTTSHLITALQHNNMTSSSTSSNGGGSTLSSQWGQYEDDLCGLMEKIIILNPHMTALASTLINMRRSNLCQHNNHESSRSSSSASSTATTRDPFILQLLPPNGTRIYGSGIPVWIRVIYPHDMPHTMRGMYSSHCKVVAILQGQQLWEGGMNDVVYRGEEEQEEVNLEKKTPTFAAQVGNGGGDDALI